MTGADYILEREGLMQHHQLMRPFWDEAELLTSPLRTLDSVKADKAQLRLIKQMSGVASLANSELASGCMSWITPEGQAWWKWKAAGNSRKSEVAKQFFLECSEVARDVLAASNFYTAMHQVYLQSGEKGTVGLYAQEGRPSEGEPLLSFEPWGVGEFQCSEDRFRRLHCIYRSLRLTAHQAKAEFGEDKLPEECRQNLAANAGHKETEFVHVLRRRTPDEINAGKDAQTKKAWASCYIDPKTKEILKESGQDEQRVFVRRWLKWDVRSPYGVSPAMMCLADIRGINHQEMLLATLGELAVNPRILVPVSHQGPVDLGPKGVTQFTNPNEMPREWAPAGDYRVGNDIIERRKATIREHFLASKFAMFAGIERELTAYEAAARREENMSMLAPASSLLNVDLIQPLLEAVFMTCLRANLMPAVPEELVDRGPTGKTVSIALPAVAQTNRMSRALANEAQAGFGEWMNTLMPAAQMVGASVFDAVNLEKAGRVLAIERGLPSELLRTEDEETKLREDRAAAQEAQQQQAAMLEMAKNPKLVETAAKAGGLQ